MVRWFALVLGLFLLVGCAATRHGRLYDLDTATVLTATYRTTGSGKGPIWIGSTRQTATCAGEYVTVANTTTSWGLIYAAGAAPVNVAAVSTGGQQAGQAIVTCADGVVIECEYVSSETAGHGACRDNRAKRYRLMF